MEGSLRHSREHSQDPLFEQNSPVWTSHAVLQPPPHSD